MIKDKDITFHFEANDILLPFLSILLLWISYWLQVNISFDWISLGVYPRTASGLVGVFFSSFVHGSLKHLANNSLTLFVLLFVLQLFYRRQKYQVILFGILLSGLGTWFIGRESYHIGASGLIYALASFLFFKGIFTKYYRLVAVSLMVVFLYGGMVWYMFPMGDNSISWEGHLSGFLSGLLLAVSIKTPEYQSVYHYDWEHPDYDEDNDPFMQYFDEDGNFNPPEPSDESEEKSE